MKYVYVRLDMRQINNWVRLLGLRVKKAVK